LRIQDFEQVFLQLYLIADAPHELDIALEYSFSEYRFSFGIHLYRPRRMYLYCPMQETGFVLVAIARIPDALYEQGPLEALFIAWVIFAMLMQPELAECPQNFLVTEIANSKGGNEIDCSFCGDVRPLYLHGASGVGFLRNRYHSLLARTLSAWRWQ